MDDPVWGQMQGKFKRHGKKFAKEYNLLEHR